MVKNYGIEMPRIIDPNMFEDLCLDLIQKDGNYENCQRNGGKGHYQAGVDIFARYKGSQRWIGVQCKVKEGKIYPSDIEKDIRIAKNFNPKLSRLYFYTTAKRQPAIQEFVRQESDKYLQIGLFDIQIIFWEDIEKMLREEKFNDVHYLYYRDFYTNIKDDGFSIGKLISLTVGYHNDLSYYPILIGKTYKKDNTGFYGLNYWKNIYYIMNFNAKRFETFPIPCYPSDLENAFKSYRDRILICKFINSIKDMNKFIESKNDEEQMCVFSEEEFKEFIYSLEDDTH